MKEKYDRRIAPQSWDGARRSPDMGLPFLRVSPAGQARRMPVPVGPRPLPDVVLSRDLGDNASRQAAAHGLVRVLHGAYVAPLANANKWQAAEHLARARVAAVFHRLTNGAVFSHESAALIHGLWLVTAPMTVHVTQQHKPSTRTPTLHRHAGTLMPEDVVEVHGIRVTSVERTVADLAKTLHPRDALILADSALRLLVDPNRDQLSAVRRTTEVVRARLMEKVETGAQHGRRQARVIVAYADPLPESPYESIVRWIALSRGLPRPELQRRFDIRGNTYYTDMYWLFELTVDDRPFRLCLIAEYDGEQKYLGGVSADDPEAAAQAVLEEKRREDDLRGMADTDVRRFDRRDVQKIEATFRRLCTALPKSYMASLRQVPELIGLARPRARRRRKKPGAKR